MMPTLSRLYSTEPGQFRQLLQRGLHLSLAGGMLVALAVAALAEPLVAWLYQASLGGAAPVLRWLIFGAVFMTADQILSSTMTAAMAQRQDMLALACALLVLLAALVGLSMVLGSVGAAMAVALAQGLRVQIRLSWAMRELTLPGLQRQWLRQLAAGIAGVAGLLLGLDSGAMPAWALAWLAWGLSALLLGILPVQAWRACWALVTMRLAQRRSLRS
jgi:O-antigen/teichoic acid export membrane protein